MKTPRQTPDEDGEDCRLDVWLFRTRLVKTRSLAAKLIAGGAVRMTRGGVQTRVDRASRAVRQGDHLVFAIAGRVHALEVLSIGSRRGPPEEARALYTALEEDGADD